jgi:hypothetical protein
MDFGKVTLNGMWSLDCPLRQSLLCQSYSTASGSAASGMQNNLQDKLLRIGTLG